MFSFVFIGAWLLLKTLQDAKAADHNDDKGHLAHQRAILEEAEVVCSTCAGADHPVLQGKDFGCVLIDEAGQTTELAVLVPLMKMRKDGVVTLVGDHRQLPPTISNVEVDVEGLGTSLFERLSSHGVEPFMLDIQYRIPALNFLLARTDFETQSQSHVFFKACPLLFFLVKWLSVINESTPNSDLCEPFQKRYAPGHRILPVRGQLRWSTAQWYQWPSAPCTAGHCLAHPRSTGDVSAGGRPGQFWDSAKKPKVLFFAY